MEGSIAPARLATLLGDFDRAPAYAGLADALTGLVCDGRVAVDLRLPSERDLSVALGLSRTTVTRAYAGLVENGFAQAQQGSGTYTRLPGGRRRGLDRTLTPSAFGDDVIDLNAAAPAALPGIAAAFADALTDLPRYLGGHGYFPTGIPVLQEAVAASYDARGLPTDPAQIMVVPGALSALTIVAQALVGARDRVLVESPGYPNAFAALRRARARLVGAPMDVDGWDLDALGRVLRTSRPSLAFLIPDFQNPTGNLMPNAQREELAALLRRTGTVAIVDESHQALALDGRPMPRPFAAFAPETVTLGSTSKSFWGGLRVGWVRCPDGVLDRLMEARVALDLGSPVLEQLAAARLLDRREELWADRRAGLRG
jgi:DNA-binding transcriptional MocR family regulator